MQNKSIRADDSCIYKRRPGKTYNQADFVNAYTDLLNGKSPNLDQFNNSTMEMVTDHFGESAQEWIYKYFYRLNI